MEAKVLDLMVAEALADLSVGEPRRVRALVAVLARRFAGQPALSLSYALTAAGAALEDLSGSGDGVAAEAYRMAALVAADVLAVESMGQRPARTDHLLHFWRRVDPYFLGDATDISASE